jgi:hypothetical protein
MFTKETISMHNTAGTSEILVLIMLKTFQFRLWYWFGHTESKEFHVKFVIGFVV